MASREEGEKCHRCGTRYLTVYRTPDDVWEKIRPNKNDPNGDLYGGLLCPMCADQLAMGHGITLYWEASVDDWRDNKLTAAEKERDRLRGLVNDVFYLVLSRSTQPESLRRAMLHWIMEHETDAPTETEGSDE